MNLRKEYYILDVLAERGILTPLINNKNPRKHLGFQRAIDGARTRGLHLGKVALYQLSYYRICSLLTATTN